MKSPSISPDGWVKALIHDELTERAEVEKKVEDARTQVEEAERALEQAQQRLAFCRHLLQARQDHSSKLLTSITEKRVAISPILRLPTDVLGEAFQWWSDAEWGYDELETGDWKWRKARSPLPSALLVCKAWNKLSISSPRLWSRLPIQIRTASVTGVKDWLRRSCGMLLSVRMDANGLEEANLEALQDILALLLLEHKRCVSIGILISHICAAEAFEFFQAPFPVLTDLCINNESMPSDAPFSMPSTFLPYAPRLERCFLRDAPFPSYTPLHLQALALDIVLDFISTHWVNRIKDLLTLTELMMIFPPETGINQTFAYPLSIRRLICDSTTLPLPRPADGWPHLGSLDSVHYLGSGYESLAKFLRNHQVQLQELTIK